MITIDSVSTIQIEGNDMVSFLDANGDYIQTLSQVVPDNAPTYISYRYDKITIAQDPGTGITFSVYAITAVGGNSFPALTFKDTSDTVLAKTREVYRLLVTSVFKGCCDCGDTTPECAIQYEVGDITQPGKFSYDGATIKFSYTTANNQDFTNFYPIVQDGSWVFLFSKTDPTVYAVVQLSGYTDGVTCAIFTATELDSNGTPFVEGTQFCVDFTSVGGNLVQGFQDVLDIDSVLTSDNDIDTSGYRFKFSNTYEFSAESTSGEEIAVGAGYVRVKTPNYGTATTGMVLALDGAGNVEYITPPAGTGTVTSIEVSGGTGISVSPAGPITTSGTFTVTNTAPDQVVVLTAGTGISISGTYPSFTIAGTDSLLYGVASGTNNYTVTITGVTAYTAGDAYIIKFTNGNDNDSDIDINGLGIKTLVKEFNVQLTGGDIVSGQQLIIMYDGTNFQTLGVAPNQLFAYVTNDDSVTITKGQPVYAFGAAGNRMSVKLAANTSDATSAQTVGVVFSNSIAAGQKGFIITQGVISGLNTSMYSPGNQLYLGSTAGSLTNVKPYAPNHLVYIGIVERANAGNGQIYIKPQNGYELDELHNVQAQTPTVNDVLYYFGGSPGQWKTASISTILGYTPLSAAITSLNALTDASQTFAIGTTGTDFNISSATSTHTFNLPTASATNRGALSSTDWSTFNSKEPAISAGTTLQYWRGDKSWQTLDTLAVPENSNLYFTDSRARSAISLTTTGTSGAATYNSSTGVLNVPQYTGSVPYIFGTHAVNAVIGAGATLYWTNRITGAGAGTLAQRQSSMTFSGTASHLQVRTSTTQPVSGALTFTVQKNGVDTALVLVIAAGSAAGVYDNVINTFTFVDGDLISFKGVNSATGNSAGLYDIQFNCN